MKTDSGFNDVAAYVKTKYNNDFDNARGDSIGENGYALRGGFRIDKHLSELIAFLTGQVISEIASRRAWKLIGLVPS